MPIQSSSAFEAPRSLGLACLLIVLSGVSSISAADAAPRRARTGEAHAGQQDAVVVARIRMDGVPCPTGVARIRPFRAGQVDTSRFVSIGYVTLYDSRPGVQAMFESMSKAVTFDISGVMKEVGSKPLLERFVPIAPGSYVITSVTCRSGQGFTRIGDDHANGFAVEAGYAIPVKGDNLIDVRPGEILDAGILDIRRDEVGLFETKTGSVVAGLAPEEEQAQLREAFRDAGKRLRFATFRSGPKAK